MNLDISIHCFDPKVTLKFKINLGQGMILKKEKFTLGRSTYNIRYQLPEEKNRLEGVRVKLYQSRTEEVSTFNHQIDLQGDPKIEIAIDELDWNISLNIETKDKEGKDKKHSKIQPSTAKTRWKWSRILC